MLGRWSVSFSSTAGAGSMCLFIKAVNGSAGYCSGDEVDVITVRALGVERIRCRMCAGTADEPVVSIMQIMVKMGEYTVAPSRMAWLPVIIVGLFGRRTISLYILLFQVSS